MSVKTPGETCHGTGNGKGGEADLNHIDTDGAGGLLVILDGPEIEPKIGLNHAVDHEQDQNRGSQHNIIIGDFGIFRRQTRYLQSHGSPGYFIFVRDDDVQDLRESQGGER